MTVIYTLLDLVWFQVLRKQPSVVFSVLLVKVVFLRIRRTSVKCRWPRWPKRGFRQGCVALFDIHAQHNYNRGVSQALDVEVKTARSKGKNKGKHVTTPQHMCLACPKLVDFHFQSINRLAGFGLSHFRRRNPLKPLALGVKRSLDPYSTCFRVRNRKYPFFVQNICIRSILNNHDSFDLCWVRDPWFAEVSVTSPRPNPLGSDCWVKFWSESALDRRNRRVVWRDLDFTWIDS